MTAQVGDAMVLKVGAQDCERCEQNIVRPPASQINLRGGGGATK